MQTRPEDMSDSLLTMGGHCCCVGVVLVVFKRTRNVVSVSIIVIVVCHMVVMCQMAVCFCTTHFTLCGSPLDFNPDLLRARNLYRQHC